MNGLCGWIGEESDPDECRSTLDKMLSVLSADVPVRRQQTGAGWGLGIAGLREGLVDLHSAGGLTAAIVGRPRINERKLAPYLEQGPARALLAAYESEREQAFIHLKGSFSAIVIDHVRRSVAIAIDRMGISSLAYTVSGSSFLFSTSCDAINSHPQARPELDPQAIYDYLYFHMIPAPRTVYRNYQRLIPGQYVVFENGQVRSSQYWSMHFEEDSQAPFAELKGEFISTLREAVREAAEDAKIGCFLSGGTDSSTLAGLLGEVTGEPARSYSIGFDEPGYDEMSYARIAAKHFSTDHHEYYVTPQDIVTAIPLIARIYDQPFGNSSAVPTYYCARMARQDGIERLIGGDGGDELFGGNERYAKQYLFSLYQGIPAPLRHGLINPLVATLSGTGGPALLRKTKSYVEQASVSMPARLETYNLVDRIGRERIFTAEFLQQINARAPLNHITGIYDGADGHSLINRMLALDFRITLADSDLPKVTNACALAGVDVAFPMLADEVVAFSARLPPKLKLKGTQLRYFFKESLRGFLPEEIINKQKHGFGLPFGHWLTKHRALHDLVTESLHQLKRRDIVKPAFLDELASQHLSVHAGYYGTMVWVLMMLELWLQEHGHRL